MKYSKVKTFSLLPPALSCKHSSPCVFMTAVTSFSWRAQRKSCYGIVDPWRCCKNPPLSRPLRLHPPSLSVVLLFPLLPCVRHVSLRLHFQVSLIVSPYMMYHLSCFTKMYPLSFDQPVLSASVSLKLPPLCFPELCLALTCSFV